MRTLGLALVCGLALLTGCINQEKTEAQGEISVRDDEDPATMKGTSELATLGGGCFWCVEAVFQNFKGVYKVASGYSGGDPKKANYKDVSSGTSGHAEVIQITFDPEVISYAEVLEIFFHAHDPTTENRQGADVGPQYRSVIFYHSPAQEEAAQKVKEEIEAAEIWKDPIVTHIVPFKEFFPAEDYHQNYYRENPGQMYCSIVIAPKLQKIYKQFAGKLKS